MDDTLSFRGALGCRDGRLMGVTPHPDLDPTECQQHDRRHQQEHPHRRATTATLISCEPATHRRQ